MKLRLGLLALVPFALVSLAGCVGGPSCGVTTGGSGTPSLVFTEVPPLGGTESLQGQELHVAPVNYYIAVYLHVGSEGWWIKPTFSAPETSINCDGSWSTDITTGGDDPQADTITAFLLPQGYTPPQLGGAAALPQALYTNSVANVTVTR
jgi:hypothetical protein